MDLKNKITLILILYLICHSCMYAQSPQISDDIVTVKVEGEFESTENAFTIDGKIRLAIDDAFLKKYPNIRLSKANMPLNIGEEIGTESHLLLAIAGGTAPDVINEFTFRKSGTFIDKGFLYPLDEWINKDLTVAEARVLGIYDENIMYKDELEQRILPQAMDAIYTDGKDGKKHFYGLPWHHEVRVLAYNKILFREAGLDPIKDFPKTWKELWEVGKILTQPDKGQYGFFGDSPSNDYLSWSAAPFFLSMNPDRVKRDPKTNEWRAVFNGPGITTAADFWIKLISAPWKHPTSGEILRGIGEYDSNIWMKWYRDEIGMVLLNANDILMNYSMWLNTLSYDEVGIAPIPKAPNGKSVSELFVFFKGILATSSDPRVREGAWKYVRFAGSDEARKLAVDTYVENNFANFVMPELLIKYGYEEYVDEVPKEWAETVRYSFKNSVPEPFGKNTQFIYPLMSRPVTRALQEDLATNPDREYRLKKLQQYFDEAVEIANEKMMKIIPEDEIQTRKIVSFIVATLIFALFIVLFIYIWRVFTPKHLIDSAHQSHYKKYKFAYLLLMPAMLGVLIFNYYPLARGALMAFQEYNVIGGSEYVGLDNFSLVFFDNHFWMSIIVAGYYTVLFLVMVFLPPIFLAILLAEVPVGNVFFRVVFYLPAVISGIVMMLMWKNFFNATDQGLLNQVVALFGLEPIRWLGNKNTAMISIMLPQAWAGMGPGCLIYLAALKTVPDDLYESVSIDGGGFLHRIRYVTLPIIKPLILIQLIFALIAAFQAADTVLVMTAGGPDNATMVVGLEIFFNAYMYQRFGVATSMAWILGFILMGFTVFQMRRLSRLTFTTADEK